jgi:hypothetical protein
LADAVFLTQQAVISQARTTIVVDTANLMFMQQDSDRCATLTDKGASMS